MDRGKNFIPKYNSVTQVLNRILFYKGEFWNIVGISPIEVEVVLHNVHVKGDCELVGVVKTTVRLGGNSTFYMGINHRNSKRSFPHTACTGAGSCIVDRVYDRIDLVKKPPSHSCTDSFNKLSRSSRHKRRTFELYIKPALFIFSTHGASVS